MAPHDNGWTRVYYATAKEYVIQGEFDRWHARDPARMFGLPDWLAQLGQPLPRTQRASFGYAFTPDVEFLVGGRHYVLELKYASKYEPLALAEVLHHAAWLRRHEAADATDVVPVVVSQFNSWLRLAVDEYLRDQVRLLEVEVLRDNRCADARLFVFDAPLAPWNLKEAPPWLAGLTGDEGRRLRWHHVPETGSWFGLLNEHEHRPVIIQEPYVWLHRHDDGTALVWEGLAPALHERWRSVRSSAGLTTAGSYHLYTATSPVDAGASPTWLSGVAFAPG